jgi:V/A-type H+-transporting ATPase subunit I
MKFVSIVGQLDHFDKFVSNYIIDSNLHPENVLNVVNLVRGIKPFPNDETKGDLLLKSCSDLLGFIKLDHGADKLEPYADRDFIPLEVIEKRLDEINDSWQMNRYEYETAVDRLRDCRLMKESLDNILNVNVNIEQFFNLEFIKFRFGRIPKLSLRQLEEWADELEMIIVPLSADDEYNWLIYFTPSSCSEKVDGIVSSMQFERTDRKSVV